MRYDVLTIRRSPLYERLFREIPFGEYEVEIDRIVGGTRNDTSFENPKRGWLYVNRFVEVLKNEGYNGFENKFCRAEPIELYLLPWKNVFYVGNGGHHRVAALKKAGFKTCRAHVIKIEPLENIETIKSKYAKHGYPTNNF